MGKRRLEPDTEEMIGLFKNDKFVNANVVVELLIQLKVLVEKDGSTAIKRQKEAVTSAEQLTKFGTISRSDLVRVVENISALTEVCLKLILDGDLRPPPQKADDMKNALEKFKDWAKERYDDITNYFTQLLLHPQSKIGKEVLKSLLKIIQHQTLVYREFPKDLYKRIILKCFDDKAVQRDLIQSISKQLSHDDLAVQTFSALDEITEEWPSDPNITYMTNLLTMLMSVRVPAKKHGIKPSPLLFSHRNLKRPKAVETDDHETPKNKPSKKKKLMKQGEKFQDKRKSKYAEVVQQTLKGEMDDEEKENDDEGVDLSDNEEPVDNEECVNKLYDSTDEFGFEITSDREDHEKDDLEFKGGQKKKKLRKGGYAMKKLEAKEQPDVELGVNDEFMEAVRRGPKLKPISDSERLLPKASFSEEGENEDGNESSEIREEPKISLGIDRDIHNGPAYKIVYPQTCVALTNIWNRVMRIPLTDELYKKCLVFIPDHVMDNLGDPLKLTDFFMDSFNFGGGIGLMAMRGVYLLITKHNLHYPEFYPKLYSLIDPMVCSVKFKHRFFLLLNVFLGSTHLPEYIAGAFVKILSRLLHYAPQHSILLILKLMNNILSRFPSLSYLYDRDGDVAADAFIIAASDLMMTKASESSLWEVATIRNCSHPKVHKAGRFIQRIHTPEEIDIKPSLLELDYEDLDETDGDNALHITGVSTNYKMPLVLLPQHDEIAKLMNIN